jgi:predicted DNA-binding transcriptional regulator AlpA
MPNQLTFEQLPSAIEELLGRMSAIENLLRTSQSNEDVDRWFSIEELIEYLPGKPTKATIYKWVSQKSIPHSKAHRLAFRKSEIDEWLQTKARKTLTQLEGTAFKALKLKPKI